MATFDFTALFEFLKSLFYTFYALYEKLSGKDKDEAEA